jgi:hypothetical protein
MVSRPIGVSILAFLSFLAGLLLFLSGSAIFFLGEFILLILPINGKFILEILNALAFFMVVLGISYLIISFGLWNGREWARMASIYISVLLIGFELLAIFYGEISALIGVLIYLLIIYYLTRPHVKRYFLKEVRLEEIPLPPPPPS